MPATSKAGEGLVYEFGAYRLDVHERLLLRADVSVALTPKAFELLVALVARGGRLVTKEEIFREVWAGSYVEEGNLTQNIYTLRKVLGESAGGETYIETVPKQGYRFVVPVRVVEALDEQTRAGAAPNGAPQAATHDAHDAVGTHTRADTMPTDAARTPRPALHG